MGLIRGGVKLDGLAIGGKSVAGIVRGGLVVFRKKKVVIGEEGIYTDPRDGQEYPYKTMPDGRVWMTVNFNYEPAGGGWWYYRNDPANGTIYGKLYRWDVAMAIAPAGWHLPTRDEWAALIGACGGSNVAGGKLKATSGWNNNGNGTDDYGFAVLPGGVILPDGSFYAAGDSGIWWTATESLNNSSMYAIRIEYNSDQAVLASASKSYTYSVRLIKDE